MVPKLKNSRERVQTSFRAVLFRMVPKHAIIFNGDRVRFRAVLFRMVPKQSER